MCERKYSWGTAKEDYVLPDAHTVAIRIAPEQLAGVTGDCTWTWQPRKAGGKAETKTHRLQGQADHRARAVRARSRHSGVSVTVKLPDGRELRRSEVMVEDLFIVALGDSFASGESNPDRPVQFSAARQMVYDPTPAARGGRASGPPAEVRRPATASPPATIQYDPKVLPRRLMDDEAAERFHKLVSREFADAFDKAAARWLSRDCHRSQYGYPFRVAMQLALENRHRAVTLASFACSGAEVTAGLFLENGRARGRQPNSRRQGARRSSTS